MQGASEAPNTDVFNERRRSRVGRTALARPTRRGSSETRPGSEQDRRPARPPRDAWRLSQQVLPRPERAHVGGDFVRPQSSAPSGRSQESGGLRRAAMLAPDLKDTRWEPPRSRSPSKSWRAFAETGPSQPRSRSPVKGWVRGYKWHVCGSAAARCDRPNCGTAQDRVRHLGWYRRRVQAGARRGPDERSDLVRRGAQRAVRATSRPRNRACGGHMKGRTMSITRRARPFGEAHRPIAIADHRAQSCMTKVTR